MPASIQPGAKPERRVIEASVYGLRQKHLAQELVARLIERHCFPSLIFRIDDFGRHLVAVDAQTGERFYVTVKRWSPAPIVIDWTSISSMEGRKVEHRANRVLRDYLAPGTPHPMLIPYEVTLYPLPAKTPAGAS